MQDKLRQIFNIADKWVLITGATGSLGRYISKAFLEVGAKVVLLGRSNALLKQVREYRKEFGEDRVFGFRVDFYKKRISKRSAENCEKV